MKNLFFLAILAVIFIACEKEPPAFGDTYQGGTIFYINEKEGYGLIVYPTEISSGICWSEVYGLIEAYDSDNGEINTEKIINYPGTGNCAAKLCDDFEGGGYTDWYLPASNELGNLRLSFLFEDMFTVYHFWASTEINNIYAANFPYNGWNDFLLKSNSHHVFAIRRYDL